MTCEYQWFRWSKHQSTDGNFRDSQIRSPYGIQHPPLRQTEATMDLKPSLHAKEPYKRPLSPTLTTKLDSSLLETPTDQIMTPNIITEAHSHSIATRMTVAQRKEAHELRKVRTILSSF